MPSQSAMRANRTYKPTLRSFVSSLVWDFSLVAVATVATYFQHDRLGILIWIADGIVGLLFLFMLVSTLNVHLQSITVDERGLRRQGPIAETSIEWRSVVSARMLERRNFISGADRLLIVQSAHGDILTFNTSTLSTADEAQLLSEVRRRVPLQQVFDKAVL